jgi:hypothetical protein
MYTLLRTVYRRKEAMTMKQPYITHVYIARRTGINSYKFQIVRLVTQRNGDAPQCKSMPFSLPYSVLDIEQAKEVGIPASLLIAEAEKLRVK